jgi:hypothetical protein
MPPDDDYLQRIEALERKVAQLEQQARRSSVQQALMDERILVLERNRLFRLWNKVYRTAANLYGRFGSGERYGGLTDLRTPGDYELWLNREQHQLESEDHRGEIATWPSQPLISVVLNAGPAADASLRSVVEQCYPNWELCLPANLIGHMPSGLRSRVVDRPTGEYRLVLHAGDRLSPHALYFYAQALKNDSPDMLYADEDHIDGHGNRKDPLFKPGWSPELLMSTMYVGRAIVSRNGNTENRCVRHIPRVLYHRAIAEPLQHSTPQYNLSTFSRLGVIICSREVRQVYECLDAIRKTAAAAPELFVVHHLESGEGEEMRQCVASFGGTVIPYRGPFNFARMNNLAATKATSPCLLFMNDDIIIRQKGWDQAIAATLARTEIGIAGALLEYPNGTIQHAGVVVGIGDGAGHCGRFQMSSELWPWLRMSRDVSAVTGAMLGIRSEVFQEMRGFDEAFPVNYNDVDLCLRVRAAKLRVVCLNVGKVIHRESQTRVGGTRHEEREELYKRWGEVLANPDEFYSVHLSPTERIGLSTGGNLLQGL